MAFTLPELADPTISTWELAVNIPHDVKVGQCLMVGFEGKALPSSLAAMLSDGLIGGVILFRRNIGTPDELRALCDTIHRTCPTCPPLISIDQEGGLVTRFSPPFTIWPSMREVGSVGSEDLARRFGLGMGRELNAAGIDITFAPVMDVNTNPKNPIIGIRSLGADPDLVCRLGAAVMEGLAEAGVIPCAKHFPGHGDTDLDSHKTLPTVSLDAETLDAVHLLPFRHAVKCACPMMMTAHVLYPALDRYYPATVSRRIIGELLRETMGYDHVIITDAMEMEGVKSVLSPTDAAFGAIKAGCDILLYGAGDAEVEEIRESLILAQQRAALMPQEIDGAVRRILELKRARLTEPPPAPDPSCIGHPEHQALTTSIREQAKAALA